MALLLPTYLDAIDRAIVRLSDGRTARLVYVGKNGGKARVVLPSGAYLSVNPAELTLEPTGPSGEAT